MLHTMSEFATPTLSNVNNSRPSKFTLCDALHPPLRIPICEVSVLSAVQKPYDYSELQFGIRSSSRAERKRSCIPEGCAAHVGTDSMPPCSQGLKTSLQALASRTQAFSRQDLLVPRARCPMLKSSSCPVERTANRGMRNDGE